MSERPDPAQVGWLRLHMTKGGIPLITVHAVKPSVYVDGYEMKVTGPVTDFALYPGQHLVEVGHMAGHGRAQCPLTIQAGAVSELYYTEPAWHYSTRGSLGPAPQRQAGMGFFYGAMGLLAVIVILLLVVPLIVIALR